jgi:hypothetical protein
MAILTRYMGAPSRLQGRLAQYGNRSSPKPLWLLWQLVLNVSNAFVKLARPRYTDKAVRPAGESLIMTAIGLAVARSCCWF